MTSISSTLTRLKQDLRPFLPDQAIESACRRAGHHLRRRKLDPLLYPKEKVAA